MRFNFCWRLFGLLLLFVLLSGPGLSAEPGMGTVRGKILVPDEQYCRGVASLWDGSAGRSPDPRRYVIIPLFAVTLNPSCEFEFLVPPGQYYVGALLRRSPGADVGPPRMHDWVFMTPDAEGGATRIELAAGQTVDLGTRGDGWIFRGMTEEPVLGVTGQVRDRAGKPVAGVLVFAFADAEMSEAPLAVSGRTDAEGRYLLSIDRPGRVYLRVKDDYGGGAPGEGGYVGFYGGTVPAAIDVPAAGVVKGLDIVVFQIPVGRSGNKGGPLALPPAEAASGSTIE